MFEAKDFHEIILTIIYSGIGMLVFTLFFVVIVKLSPFPIIKEIEQDQNVALAILLGAVVIGLSIIIAAAIVG